MTLWPSYCQLYLSQSRESSSPGACYIDQGPPRIYARFSVGECVGGESVCEVCVCGQRVCVCVCEVCVCGQRVCVCVCEVCVCGQRVCVCEMCVWAERVCVCVRCVYLHECCRQGQL